MADETADLKARLAILENKVDDLRSFLKWFGGLLVTLMISLMGWSLLQQFNANEAQKQDLSKQVMLLQAQEQNRRLSSGGAEAPAPASGVAQGVNLGGGGTQDGAQH